MAKRDCKSENKESSGDEANTSVDNMRGVCDCLSNRNQRITCCSGVFQSPTSQPTKRKHKRRNKSTNNNKHNRNSQQRNNRNCTCISTDNNFVTKMERLSKEGSHFTIIKFSDLRGMTDMSVDGQDYVCCNERSDRGYNKKIEPRIWNDNQVDMQKSQINFKIKSNHHQNQNISINQTPFPQSIQKHQQSLPPRNRQNRSRRQPSKQHQKQFGIRPKPRKHKNQKRQRIHSRDPHIMNTVP
mmetsp:Transcript_14969/g.20921  ORF Transcript_14969/g.20921 Transcript_14969/m.20921 type:complete len:241 (-) Transcript_14969:2030-2752(-)